MFFAKDGVEGGTDKDQHDSKIPTRKDPSSYFGVEQNKDQATLTKARPINQFARPASCLGIYQGIRKAEIINRSPYMHRLESTYRPLRGKGSWELGQSPGE